VGTRALAEKVIVIVGGTSGLGLSAARACAAEGARLVLIGRDHDSTAAAVESVGAASARAFIGDATHPDTAGAAVDLAVREFRRFDALYHVAGGSGRSRGDGPLDRITDLGWRFTLDMNLTSTFNSNRAAARQFLRQGSGGCVLNMSSALAFSPSPEFFTTHAYAAAKAGIIGLTRSAAAHYAPQNIRFNVIAPALIETPMSKRAAGDERIMKFIHSKQPLDGGRIGQPEDLDGAVVFLLSDAAKFVTGQVLSVDGGWDVSEGQVPT
jgi:NAD(P)-dependent dehydrogenase (short-subunit alcohol dehydrogenase family)